MSNADDTVIIRELTQKLRTHVADLDVELGEEGSLTSPSLESAEKILQDAIRQLEAELERLAKDQTDSPY
jgi:CRISPR/Cas system-associated protein Cas10 (large subunit of type III CRISPR-Cas system)